MIQTKSLTPVLCCQEPKTWSGTQ